MPRTVAIGISNFNELIENNLFYIDKTEFIQSWWNSGDKVTLITRPRRFGKTLTMSMLNCFFSVQYQNRSDLFENCKIWQQKKFRSLQGIYPVMYLSFSDAKAPDFTLAKQGIVDQLLELYSFFSFLKNSPKLSDIDKTQFDSVQIGMNTRTAAVSLKLLSKCLYKHFEKKVIIILDEYDTPMLYAYKKHYWEELADFMRSFFNATFKDNPYMERAVMTGITRITKQSMFSDLNNLSVADITSAKYADVFGFTKQEVFSAMDEYGKTEDDKKEVERWYDGFCFGNLSEIYNPWSIINYLRDGVLSDYWADTSSNDTIQEVIIKGDKEFKCDVEALMNKKTIIKPIDEHIALEDLDQNNNVVWSLLLSAGYLRIVSHVEEDTYELALTNYEVQKVFRKAVDRWLRRGKVYYNEFVKALLADNLPQMNDFLKEYILYAKSYQDSDARRPEIFYHGFVLGIIAELHKTHYVESNRESGHGRADVMIYPRDGKGNAIILEFKALDESANEKQLSDTVAAALKQIEEKNYAAFLNNHGFDNNHIKKYGIAFQDKNVLVAKDNTSLA